MRRAIKVMCRVGGELRTKRWFVLYFDDALPGFELLQNFRQQWLKPLEQHSFRVVADPQPDNGRAFGRIKPVLDKVFVFHDENPFTGDREVPDASVV